MTLDQYLGTVAWLFISTMIALVIYLTRDAVVNMNRHPSTCSCRKCTGPYGIKKKYAGYDCAPLSFIPLMAIALPVFLISAKRANNGNDLVVNWIIIVAFWSACPLYIWVSTSFAFNITYIGG